jgi:hypothetical protein
VLLQAQAAAARLVHQEVLQGLGALLHQVAQHLLHLGNLASQD